MSLFRKKSIQKGAIERIKKEEIDFSSMFAAINNRAEIEQLFKSLSRRCHPDVYVSNPDKMALAEELFKKVMANSTNYEELVELEKTIYEKLES